MSIGAFIGTALGKVVLAGVGSVLALGLIGGGLYAADFGVEATVVDKSCRTSASTVTVETELGGLDITQELPFDRCTVVQPGNFVVYNIRSERLRLYQAEGGCLIYDSASGISNQCAGGGGGGGTGGGLFPGTLPPWTDGNAHR